jgi:hypothetical protein
VIVTTAPELADVLSSAPEGTDSDTAPATVLSLSARSKVSVGRTSRAFAVEPDCGLLVRKASGSFAQLTAIAVTLAAATEPLALVAVQVWPAGCVSTVTA